MTVPETPSAATPAPAAAIGAPRRRLWIELVGLFVGVPVAMALAFAWNPGLMRALFGAVLALAGVAAALLAVTPGFRFAELARGGVLGHWRLVLGFTLAVALSSLAVTWALVPEDLFAIPLERTGLWVMIMVLYPLVSALPQELIYRPLFFRRYGALFPSQAAAIAANGLLFGIGHLFYLNPLTIGGTVVVGAFIGWAYLRSGSFLLAWVLHAVAGQLVFTIGLGRFFYHGAI